MFFGIPSRQAKSSGEIELELPAAANLKTFVDQWSDDVSDAQGQCANLAAKSLG